MLYVICSQGTKRGYFPSQAYEVKMDLKRLTYLLHHRNKLLSSGMSSKSINSESTSIVTAVITCSMLIGSFANASQRKVLSTSFLFDLGPLFALSSILLYVSKRSAGRVSNAFRRSLSLLR